MKRIGVLISGGGTNLQALIDKQGTVLKSGKIVCVCSNNSKAYGLERAKNAGIATKVIRKNADCGGDNDEFNRQICAYMKEMDVDVIVLAGFWAVTCLKNTQIKLSISTRHLYRHFAVTAFTD